MTGKSSHYAWHYSRARSACDELQPTARMYHLYLDLLTFDLRFWHAVVGSWSCRSNDVSDGLEALTGRGWRWRDLATWCPWPLDLQPTAVTWLQHRQRHIVHLLACLFALNEPSLCMRWRWRPFDWLIIIIIIFLNPGTSFPGCETLSKVCGVWNGYTGDSEIVIIIIIHIQ